MNRTRSKMMAGGTAVVAAGVAAMLMVGGNTGATPTPKETHREVVRIHGDLVHYGEDLKDFAQKAAAVVRAVAGAAVYEEDPASGNVYTHQSFETQETYWGEAPPTFTAFFAGGIGTSNGETFLMEDPEQPQFEEGKEYFLVLVPREGELNEYFVLGGSQGRYEIVAERLQALPVAQEFAVESMMDGETVQEAVRTLRGARGRQ